MSQSFGSVRADRRRGNPHVAETGGVWRPALIGTPLAGATAWIVGGTVLFGWWYDLPVLKSVVPGLVSMKPNTAVGFMLTGLALLMCSVTRPGLLAHGLRFSCALLALLIGSVTLAEFGSGIDLGIDQLLFEDSAASAAMPPGRMPPVAAANFVIIGLGLLLAGRSAVVVQMLSLVALWVGLLVSLGYLYGVPHLVGLGSYSQMAVHTAVTFVVLSSGMLMARPSEGPVAVLLGGDVGGIAARRLLPPILSVLVLFGALTIVCESHSWISLRFGIATMVLGSVVVCSLLIWLSARRLSEIDRERQQAERKTAEQRDWLETTLTSIGDAVITTNKDGEITFLNHVAERLTGWKQAEAAGQSLDRVVRIIVERSRSRVPNPVKRVLEEGAIVRLESEPVLLVRRDGREIPISDSVAPMRLSNSLDVHGVVLVFRDVRHQRQAEAALRESEAKLQSILDNTQSAVFAKDLEGRYGIANRHLAEMFGWPDESWPLGKTDADLFDGRLADQYSANDRKVRETNTALEFEEIAYHDGRTHTYLVQKFPLRDAHGQITGVCGIATDISRRKRVEQFLKLRARQQQAAAELGRFALTEPDLQCVLDQCARTVADVLDSEFCKILELFPSRDQLLLRAGVGWNEGLVGQATLETGCNSHGGYTLASNGPVVVEDLDEEERFIVPWLLRDHGIVSGMSCVIPGPEQQSWGVIGTHSASKRKYTIDDVNFLQTVAHVIASALQRHNAELALQESEERLRFTLQAARVGSWDWDIETGLVRWSENLEAIHDLAAGTFGGRIEDVMEEVYPPDRVPFQQTLEDALRGDGLFETAYRIVRSDGSLACLHTQGRAVFNGEGHPVRMAGICMDVTERRRGEELTRLLAEAGAHLGQSMDYESSLQIVAELLVPSLGDWCAIDLLGPDESLRNVASVHSQPEQVDRTRNWRRSLAESDDGLGMRQVIRAGKPLLHEISDECLRSSTQSGEYLEILRGLELRSAMIAPLKARGRSLGTITLASAKTVRRYAKDDLGLLEELATRCALAVDNARLYEESQREIEHRKRTEHLLAEATAAATAANAAKSEFLANMSHEIRTPMTAILGYADILGDNLADPDDLQCVETIRRNGRFLIEVINDILDLSKIEAGRLVIERKRLRPDELVADVLSLMDVRAHEKRLRFTAELDAPIPETIQSDATRLRQILINLVGNAIKFTDTGHVALRVRLLPAEEQLEFDIIDTGIGMSPEQLSRVFEPFTQGDSSIAGRFGGTGLGLTISHRLADMLGGEIHVCSELGEGTVFTVTVATGPLDGVPLVEPCLDLNSTPPTFSELPDLDCCVLVVDDRRDVRFLAEHLIQEAGGRVMTASNGEEAVEVLRQATQSGRRVDLVLMDMQMPVLDGYDSTVILRKQGFTGPIIALTANAMHGDRERCLEAGCDDYTSKPLDGPQLVKLIAHYTQDDSVAKQTQPRSTRSAQDADRAAQSLLSEAGGCRVLLVDDSEDVCRLMKMLLESRGHVVRTALDGRTAMAVACDFDPEVVLLDLTLPDLSGCDVARQLQSLPETQEAVLIALTGRGDDETLRHVKDAGFHHHVLKPADAEELERLFPVTASNMPLPE